MRASLAEDRYRGLFDTIDDGLCVMELIPDRGARMKGLVFREVNAAFERHTGLCNVIDRTAGELLPSFEPHWLETCSRVAQTGNPEHIESFVPDVERWCRMHHSRIGGPGSRQVAVIFEDISDRKRAEIALRDTQERRDLLLKLSDTLRPLTDPTEIRREACRILREHLGTHAPPAPDGDLAEMLMAQFPAHHALTPTQIVLLDETTERARAAVARARTAAALRESEARLALVFMTLPIGVALVALTGETLMLNDHMRRFLPTGVVPSRDPARQWRWRGFDPNGRRLEPRDFPTARALHGEAVMPGIEMLYTQDDGREVWTMVGSAPLHDIDGRITGAFCVVQDIDEIKRRQTRQATLLHELQHRVRNTLAMVRSIVGRTIQKADNVESVGKVLEGRIDALARVQASLTRRAGVGVDLENLIRGELLAQTADPSAFDITGPGLSLGPKAAEVLTLAVHELATNASQHGAIRHNGSVMVSWHTEPRADGTQWLRLSWVERGVKVGAANRRGVGIDLIERRVPYELGGAAHVELRRNGLRAELAFPLVPGESILATDS